MKKGFTLIEILIATVIFAQVTLVGATTLSSVRRLSNQTRILQAKQQSMRNALETIKRDVRCAKTVDGVTIDSDSQFTLKNQTDGKKYRYSFSDGAITKTNESNVATKLTADNVTTQDLKVNGVSGAGNKPAYLYVKIKLNAVDQTAKEDSYEAETIAVPRGQQCQ